MILFHTFSHLHLPSQSQHMVHKFHLLSTFLYSYRYDVHMSSHLYWLLNISHNLCMFHPSKLFESHCTNPIYILFHYHLPLYSLDMAHIDHLKLFSLFVYMDLLDNIYYLFILYRQGSFHIYLAM